MTESTVSVRVEKKVHEQMQLHDEVNWSAVLRKSIVQHIEALEHIDRQRAKQATFVIDGLRKTRAFDKGKSSVELVREWRQKRK